MSDYISKSALNNELDKKVHPRVNAIDTFRMSIQVIDELPTLDETEIIRKAFERVVERMEEQSFDMSLENPDCKAVWLDRAKEIVKEECGINE